MIVIIGAGISGLSLAYFLQKAGKEYILLESRPYSGGVIQTKKINNCYLELGPNSILCDQYILDFLSELGLEKEIILANDVNKSRYIYRNEDYRVLPDNPPALLFNSFFSFQTKAAIAKEFFKKAEYIPNESLSHFFERRFSKEIVDYAVKPFIAGIYSGNSDELLVSETFPLLQEYEQKFGSVLRGFMKNKPMRKKSLTFNKGMKMLPETLANHLKNIVYDAHVTSLKIEGDGYTIRYRSGQEENEVALIEVKTDKVVLALPAQQAGKILPDFALDKAIKNIKYVPVSIVHSVYDKEGVLHPLNGFGALHPEKEGLLTSGTIWNSSIFKDRCGGDKILLTSFIRKFIPDDEKESTLKKVHKELSLLLGLKLPPAYQHFLSWENAIPQYTLEYKEAKSEIRKAEERNLYVCANWYNGVSITDCIKKAAKMAEIL
ncbi:MAG: protoporphyrinogen oxidase [Cytophagaceae bacterium]